MSGVLVNEVCSDLFQALPLIFQECAPEFVETTPGMSKAEQKPGQRGGVKAGQKLSVGMLGDCRVEGTLERS